LPAHIPYFFLLFAYPFPAASLSEQCLLQGTLRQIGQPFRKRNVLANTQGREEEMLLGKNYLSPFDIL
jgi:hypothetical protein